MVHFTSTPSKLTSGLIGNSVSFELVLRVLRLKIFVYLFPATSVFRKVHGQRSYLCIYQTLNAFVCIFLFWSTMQAPSLDR